jgi:periplasmic divalent cation tolerance protein
VTDKIIVLSTCGSSDEALGIARALVDARVAACVNILPSVRSVYRWKGALEDSAEVMLVIKTRRDLFPRLQVELRKAHSYEVPEAVAIPIVDGLEAYLNWIDQETST